MVGVLLFDKSRVTSVCDPLNSGPFKLCHVAAGSCRHPVWPTRLDVCRIWGTHIFVVVKDCASHQRVWLLGRVLAVCTVIWITHTAALWWSDTHWLTGKELTCSCNCCLLLWLCICADVLALLQHLEVHKFRGLRVLTLGTREGHLDTAAQDIAEVSQEAAGVISAVRDCSRS